MVPAAGDSLSIELNRQPRCSIALSEVFERRLDRLTDFMSSLVAPTDWMLQPGIKPRA